MGNSSSSARDHRRQSQSSSDRPTTSAGSQISPIPNAPVYSSRSGRVSTHDLSFLGLGSGGSVEIAEGRRESKQEREARKLEKERVARLKERERSMKEEHVDGGYLVTQGVYTGIEDFNKPIVRQLMLERRIAPFWRGLDDHRDDWTEHQLVAAGRGFPIPPADEVPAEDPARSAESQTRSNGNAQSLMVPIAARSPSSASEFSASLSPSHPAFSPTSTSPPISSPHRSSSQFRPRSKTVASLTTSSRNPSQSDIVPREIKLPKDPYVNGQVIEAFLYKDATECPICFLYYPPYLNKTRCCDQAICSECFVQIKRPDPHPPEHSDPSNPDQNTEAGDPETLVSEPSMCPYCQQSEFGVTYEPPPFRRGLSYPNMANLSSAMSSSSSISSESPSILPTTQRRRTTSISANNPAVITTDRIRPDWATKLSNARNHVARRSAAATALHTAAYLMVNNGGSEGRGFVFGGRRTFGRSRGNGGAESSSGPAEGGGRNNNIGAFAALAERSALSSRGNHSASDTNRRRSRLDDLEDMMLNEAIRLSLAAEEERSKKEEKERKKTEKKKEKEREKEAKKAEKAARKTMYGGGSSASASTLSLSLPGRRRGSSTNSTLSRDVNNADKGKGVERMNSLGNFSSYNTGASPSVDLGRHNSLASSGDGTMQTPTVPAQSSHLRYMSNASSPASSFVESANGSLNGQLHGSNSSCGDSPIASGPNVNALEEHNSGSNTEPMFNFRRLAETIGEEDAEDKAEAAKHVEYLSGESSHEAKAEAQEADAENQDDSMDQSVATVKPGDSEDWSTPELTITPFSPTSPSSEDDPFKRVGEGIHETLEAQDLV